MKRTTASLHLSGSVVLVALGAASWAVSIGPALARAHEADAVSQAVAEASQAVLELEQQEQRSRQEVEQASAQLESVSVKLVSIDERNSRLAELTALATDAGLVVDEVAPGEPGKGELFEMVTIRLRGRGAYSDLAGFMHRLSAEHPDTEIRTFRTARSGNEGAFEMRLVWRALPSTTKRHASP